MGRSCLMPPVCQRLIASFGIPYLSRTSVFTVSDAGAPTADGAGEASPLGYRAVETTGTENFVASHADHQTAVVNQPLPAVAFFLCREKIVFHCPGHFALPFCLNCVIHIEFSISRPQGPGYSGQRVGSAGLPTYDFTSQSVGQEPPAPDTTAGRSASPLSFIPNSI